MGGKKCLAFDVYRVFDVIPYMVMVIASKYPVR